MATKDFIKGEILSGLTRPADRHQLKKFVEEYEQVCLNRDHFYLELGNAIVTIQKLKHDNHFLNKEIKQLSQDRYDTQLKLDKAIRFLEEGKRRFAPDTTNSFVDDFIADNTNIHCDECSQDWPNRESYNIHNCPDSYSKIIAGAAKSLEGRKK